MPNYDYEAFRRTVEVRAETVMQTATRLTEVAHSLAKREDGFYDDYAHDHAAENLEGLATMLRDSAKTLEETVVYSKTGSYRTSENAKLWFLRDADGARIGNAAMLRRYTELANIIGQQWSMWTTPVSVTSNPAFRGQIDLLISSMVKVPIDNAAIREGVIQDVLARAVKYRSVTV